MKHFVKPALDRLNAAGDILERGQIQSLAHELQQVVQFRLRSGTSVAGTSNSLAVMLARSK